MSRHDALRAIGLKILKEAWLYATVNWATGLPGVQPKWEGEYSVFVGDIGRETTEGELVVRDGIAYTTSVYAKYHVVGYRHCLLRYSHPLNLPRSCTIKRPDILVATALCALARRLICIGH